MDFGFGDIMQILGSLAFFIYGMKMMSDGIQRAAGSQLRNILRTMTKNRFLGAFTGFLTTALVQSSSATTVMTVSFVNAGLLTLIESAGIMMGANVGTTITGWIISILGFKLKLNTISVPLFAIGLPMLLSNRGKFKYWGEFLIGFAILFLGLGFLKDAVPDIKSNPEALEFLNSFANWGFLSRLFFVLIGTILTVIVQSSSAAMAITLTMCFNGWLPLDIATAMILGENIGTTITAQLASLVGNVNAKRAAWFHTLFNVFGVLWMVILMPFYIDILIELLQYLKGILGFEFNDPRVDPKSMPITLSAFHTTFNIFNMLILIGFLPFLVGLTLKIVKSKGEDDDIVRLKFIDTAQKTPELATVELQKETARYGEITSRMSGFTRSLLNTTEEAEREDMYKKLVKYEDITDQLEIEITEYITKLSNQELTPKTSIRLRSFLNICNDLERIGDIYFQMYKTLENKYQNKLYFTIEQRNGLNGLMDLVDEAFTISLENLNAVSYDQVSVESASEKENEINKMRDKLRKFNMENLNDKDYNVNSAMIFTNMFSSLEKVGDHLINITEAIVGEI